MAKLRIVAFTGNVQRGLEVNFVITNGTGEDEKVESSGSFNIAISHPDECKNIFDQLREITESILENKAFLNKPDIVITNQCPANVGENAK